MTKDFLLELLRAAVSVEKERTEKLIILPLLTLYTHQPLY